MIENANERIRSSYRVAHTQQRADEHALRESTPRNEFDSKTGLVYTCISDLLYPAALAETYDTSLIYLLPTSFSAKLISQQ